MYPCLENLSRIQRHGRDKQVSITVYVSERITEKVKSTKTNITKELIKSTTIGKSSTQDLGDGPPTNT